MDPHQGMTPITKEEELNALIEEASTISLKKEDLDEIGQLIQKQLDLESALMKAEALMATINAQLLRVRSIELPDMMDQMKIPSFVYKTVEIKVSPFYSAKIPEDREEEALTWLDDNNHSDIIKNDLSLSFKRGEDDKASDIEDLLIEKGYIPNRRMYVHHSTLKAFVKEMVESGQPIPHELFGIFVGKIAKIKQLKKG